MNYRMIPATRNNVEEVMMRAAAIARKEEVFEKGGFRFSSLAGHILESACRHDTADSTDSCLKCRYSTELNLEELPEMVFARNVLSVEFGSSSRIEFNALDALRRVCGDRLPDIQVAPSKVWQSARKDRLKTITEQHKPFDWTFSTDYRGSVVNCKVEQTEERIDMERLKRRDKIVFHSSVTLFEDELADHGIAQLSARIRVMEAGYFFVLLRFYMRVDNVLVRVYDTRIVGDNSQNYVIREWQKREAKYEELMLPNPELFDVDRAWMHLPVVETIVEKITANS